MRRHISFFLYFLFLCCLWGCNTDNDITVPDRKPISISFDNLSGVYELKTRKQLSITPAVKNAVNPRYKWTNDEGKTVATGLTLNFHLKQRACFISRSMWMLTTVQPARRSELMCSLK